MKAATLRWFGPWVSPGMTSSPLPTFRYALLDERKAKIAEARARYNSESQQALKRESSRLKNIHGREFCNPRSGQIDHGGTK
jgi:hypothetical protein